MNLNIHFLLKDLAENTQEILEKIHNDPKLTKRQCEFTGLWIANASKELFTPIEQHQLYAKGIIYERLFNSENEFTPYFEYKLIALGYLKIYNFDENQWAKEHVNNMLRIGAEPVFTQKIDGSFIGRFVYNNKVYLFTRGMIETMVETEEQRQYFRWAWDVIADKYPKINNPEYADAGTCLFELIGPGNQIVTHYPKWDLIQTGFIKVERNDFLDFENKLSKEIDDNFKWCGIRYTPHEDLVQYCEDFNFAKPVTKLYAFGETIEEQIESINRLFSATDEEGTVIQFELEDPKKIGRKIVVGRIKAKTETYRKLLKLMNGCNYETISSLIKSDFERFKYWENFKSYLMSIGSAVYPEELFQTYETMFEDFWKHNMYSEKICNKIYCHVSNVLDENKIKFEFNDSNGGFKLDKNSRANFAMYTQDFPYQRLLFSALDGKLNAQDIRDKLFPTLSEIKEVCQKIGIKTL